MKPAAAALAVALLGYGLFLLAAFFLTGHVARTGGALVGTAALLHFAPLTLVAAHAWSETTALACLGLYLLLLLKARESGSAAALLTVGGVGGLAFLARLAMLPVVPVGIMALVRFDSRQKTARNVLFFAGGFLLCAAPVLVHRGSGLPALTAVTGPGQALKEMGTAVCTDLVPERPGMQALCVLLLAVSVSLLFRRGRSETPKGMNRRRWSPYVLPVWALSYLAPLAYSRCHMFIDPLGYRLVIPATSVLLLFVAALFVNHARPPFWLCAAFALLLAGMAAFSELQSARLIAGAKLPPVYAFEAQRRQCETLAWLRRNVGPEDIVIAEDGMDLPLFVGPMNVLYFSGAVGKAVSADDLGHFLERHREQFQHAYLILKTSREMGDSDSARCLAGLNAYRSRACLLARLKDGEILAL
jgi:hypothetical protein